MNKKILYFLSLICIFFLVFLDQITKFMFTEKSFFEGFLISIKYAENLGSAFGIFNNVPFYSYFILFLSLLIILIIILAKDYFLKNKLGIIIFIFLLSGVIGNLLDRIFFDYVRDFIALKYLFIFNLADFYLFIAFIFFVYFELLEEFGKKTKKISKKNNLNKPNNKNNI